MLMIRVVRYGWGHRTESQGSDLHGVCRPVGMPYGAAMELRGKRLSLLRPGPRAVSNFPTGTIVWQVDAVESASETDAAESLPVAIANFANTSNLVCTDDTVYVGAGWSVCSFDRETGACVARDTEGNAYSPLVRSLAFAQRSGGGGRGPRACGPCRRDADGPWDRRPRPTVERCLRVGRACGRAAREPAGGRFLGCDVLVRTHQVAGDRYRRARRFRLRRLFQLLGGRAPLAPSLREPRHRRAGVDRPLQRLLLVHRRRLPPRSCGRRFGCPPFPRSPLWRCSTMRRARSSRAAPSMPRREPALPRCRRGCRVREACSCSHRREPSMRSMCMRGRWTFERPLRSPPQVRRCGTSPAAGATAAPPSCARPVVVGGTALVNQAVPEGGEWHLIAVGPGDVRSAGHQCRVCLRFDPRWCSALPRRRASRWLP